MRRSLPLVASVALLAGCADTPLNVPLRALSSSGPVAFVCLGAPGDLEDAARPLSECSAERTSAPDDYTIPHLYALVTQLFTGEVAVIDLTTSSNALVDQNQAVPGTTFLPTGAQPTDIVATPGGMATFVASAQPGFEAIYAMPSNMIRGEGASLTDWPSCALPVAPGKMLIGIDEADASGATRYSCDADYGASDPDEMCEGSLHCHGDLSVDAQKAQRPGRYKLLVALPSAGGIAVIDAQAILDQDGGAREPCRIDRWLPLEVDVTANPEPEPTPSDACVEDPVASGPTSAAFAPEPAGMTLSDGTLYVADTGAPVIHRVDLPSPCEPRELAPLLATSHEDPTRIVTTSRVAVSPLTLDLQRYLYAIDRIDGSIMVYDVSEGVADRTPLERARPELNPFQPPDRIRFQAPPRDIVVVQHQNDSSDSQTGSTVPVRCDPDPESSGPGTVYQTSPSFDGGAGPTRLRGVFAFAVLDSGDIVVIDVDDYDAPCRGPKDQGALFGCAEPFASESNASGEYTCNAVEPHTPRSASYLFTAEGLADNQPGVASYPLLFDSDGAVLQLDEENAMATLVPRMRATVPVAESPSFTLAVGTAIQSLSDEFGLLLTPSGDIDPSEHTLAMNLVDPRAHILDQTWNVIYEGAIIGFADRFAELLRQPDGSLDLREVTSAFCSRGVMSEAAFKAQLLAEGLTEAEATTQAIALADYVQIFSSTPVETDAYWSSQGSCSFSQCQQTYGNIETTLLPPRDFRIVEATEDRLSLVPRGAAPDPDVKCCFPGVVEFRVRVGGQWIVQGNQVGFLHNVTVDDDGTCRPTCASDEALLTGRVRETPPNTVVTDGDPRAFQNPFFRFAINAGDSASTRDMIFQFTTRGGFVPLTMSIVPNDLDVQPTSATFLSPTGELVVSDGSLEGITLLDLDVLAPTRQYN